MINFEEEELKKIVQEIARNNGLNENTKIIFSKGSGRGDGYLGEIVNIRAIDDVTEKSLDFVAKIGLKDDNMRSIYPYSEVFRNEILAYEEIIESFLNLQEKANLPSIFNPSPIFYSASSVLNEEYLILENMKISNFEMLGIKQLLDDEHTRMICETYGKFHGLSLAMKTLHEQKFFELAAKLSDVYSLKAIEKDIKFFFEKIWISIRNVMKEKDEKWQIYNNYADNCLDIMDDMCDLKDEKYFCFLHGDCWTNNLMFRYKEGQKHLQEIKLIDWQSCRIGPPVCDLSYMLYSGASKEVLSNLEIYLKIYHNSLSSVLSQLKLDVNTVYPFEEMKRQWRKYYHYAVILSGLIWKFRSFGENQGVDPLNFKSEDGSSYIDAIVDADCDTDYFCEHIKSLFDHLDEIANGNILGPVNTHENSNTN
ncbi:hypothetical protein WA026_017832 [Henosepilachna vigintioctopunctata]|uniref:CHK kinase-like domain-containing protein n=1 Tax=Henosepilachna vigintioctopunctata TaxID=420089 RepID=A0AAW1TNM7_9CUCU